MTLESLKTLCETHDLPIMSEAALNYTKDLILQHHLHQVLELGSCWGYSAIYLAMTTPTNIISIERDLERHTQARYHVRLMNLEQRVHMLYDDALSYTPNQWFDLIVIDAAKAQNQAFVDRYYEFLRPNGYIVIDNTEFHGLLYQTQWESKNLKTMIHALQSFHNSIKEDDRFKVEFLSIGDGLIILQKRD